ncbi:MAG: hypothetical protein NVSMB63_07110 [Sediminibacterium sp.]
MQERSNRNLLWQYAGLAFQLLLGLGLAVYAGMWLDKKMQLGAPVAVWVLPLLLLIAMIVKVIRDTSKK